MTLHEEVIRKILYGWNLNNKKFQWLSINDITKKDLNIILTPDYLEAESEELLNAYSGLKEVDIEYIFNIESYNNDYRLKCIRTSVNYDTYEDIDFTNVNIVKYKEVITYKLDNLTLDELIVLNNSELK